MTAIAKLVDDVRKKKDDIINDANTLSASPDAAADESTTSGVSLKKRDAFILPEKTSIRELTTKSTLKTKQQKPTFRKAKWNDDADDGTKMDESFSSARSLSSSCHHATGVGTIVDQKEKYTIPSLLPNAVATRNESVNDDVKAVKSSKMRTLVKSAREVGVTLKLTTVQQESLVNADNDGSDSTEKLVKRLAKKSEKAPTHPGTKENKPNGIINDYVLHAENESSLSSHKKKSRNVEQRPKHEIRLIDPFRATPNNEVHTPDGSDGCCRNNSGSGVAAVVRRQKIASAWPPVTVDPTGTVSATAQTERYSIHNSADGGNNNNNNNSHDNKHKARTSKAYQDTSSRALSLISETNSIKSTQKKAPVVSLVKDDKPVVRSHTECSKHVQSAELSIGAGSVTCETTLRSLKNDDDDDDRLKTSASNNQGNPRTQEALLILNKTDDDKPMTGTNAHTNQVDAVRLSMLDLDALDEGLAKVWAKFDDKASNEKKVPLDAVAEAKDASAVVTPDYNKAKKHAGTTFDENNFAPEVESGNRDGVLLQPGCAKETTKGATEAEPVVKGKADTASPQFESSQDYNHITAKQPHKMIHEPSDEESTLASTVTGFYGSPVSYVEFSKLQDGLSHDDNMTTTTMKVQEVARCPKEDGSLAVHDKGRENVAATPNDSRLSFLPKLLAVDLWSESVCDVKAALDQYAGLCSREQNIADILKHGGHLSLTVILRKWPASSIIQTSGLAALFKAAESLEFSAAVVQLGALDLIIVAMKNHAAKAEVLVAGCGALLNLTVSAAHAKILVFELHGIQTICKACAAYPANMTLQKYALWIVQYFSYWEDFKAPIVAAGGLEILAEMVENFSARSRCDGNQSADTIRKSALATMKRLL